MQALLARQRGSFNFTLAYTFSKALGIRSGRRDRPSAPSTSSSPYRDFNYGVGNDDRTHVRDRDLQLDAARAQLGRR